MEIANDGPKRVEQMPRLQSKSLDAPPLTEPATAGAPRFHALWDQGRPLHGLGVPDDDVALLETVQAGLALSWQLSQNAADLAAAARQREQIALTWARLLLEVRCRDVRRRAKSATLTPALLDRWDDLTWQLTGDLHSVGWRLGTEADLPAAARWADGGALDLSEISWPAPSTGDGRPRWARPPLLPPAAPGDRMDSLGGAMHFLGQAELARPTRAPTPWHDLALIAAWACAARSPGGEGSPVTATCPSGERIAALWAAAGRISDRQCASGLDGPDSALKQAVVEEFWVPLYALADAAFGLAAAPTDAGRAWLAALAEQLGCLELVVRPATETEPTRFRQAGLGEAAGRPALIDLCGGRTVCYGLLPRRGPAAGQSPVAAATTPAQRMPVAATSVRTAAPASVPRDRNAKLPAAGEAAAATATIAPAEVLEAAEGSAIPHPTATTETPAPRDASVAADIEQRAAQSVWHALVCDLFDSRVSRSKASIADQALRGRLLVIATRIDCRQQELVLDGADDGLKQMIADQFWRPLYILAEATFGLSTQPGNSGAAWLEGMRAALAAVQLDVIPPGVGNADAGWFRKPNSSVEPPGRPALIDAATAAVVDFGTYSAGGR